jgi:hypothetical protein
MLSYLVVCGVYVTMRLVVFLPASIRRFPDSGTYLDAAHQSLFSLSFFAGGRAFTLPLFYKLLPDSDTARTVGQLALSIGCWIALAMVVAWSVRKLRLVSFCLVLLFSLSVWITQWDRVVLSESLSISLGAAALAAWLALVRAPSRWTFGAVLVTMLAWVFARDTNAYYALLTVPFVVAWAALAGRRRGPLLLAVGLVAMFAANLASSNAPAARWARWEMSLLNVIGTRVLTNEGELQYFRAAGMPLPRAMAAAAGTPLGESLLGPDERLSTSPALAPFRRWARADGRQTLVLYLLSHPGRAFGPVFRDSRDVLGTGSLADYRPRGASPRLPGQLASAVYPSSPLAVVAWLGVAALVCLALAWKGSATRAWIVPAVALALELPGAVIAWQGDSAEVSRHELLVGVLTRLSVLLLSIYAIDAILSSEWVRARTGRRPLEDHVGNSLAGATIPEGGRSASDRP